MTISYNWLLDYLPEPIEPEKLSSILTSIGLEVNIIHYQLKIKINQLGQHILYL
jgi:phenylalanyl-tRNA synthetase beta chain